MRADVPSLLPLVCPACRTRTRESRDMHTLAVARTFRATGDEIEEGSLRCENAACKREYPIIDGVPLVVPDLAAFLRSEAAAVVERDLTPEAAGLLALAGPDDAPVARLLEHLSIYLDAHWGDRATPPPDGVAFGMAQLASRVAHRSEARVERAVELGCSVGRAVAELARGADLVVGVDVQFGALRRARRILSGQPLPYARRLSGRHYGAAVTRGEDLGGRVTWVCADALDPPLVPGAFGRVAALNLLDSVRTPKQLLSVVDGLCANGGELLLCSPYTWQTGVVDEDARLGGADPGADLITRLREGTELEAPYTIEEQVDLAWSLRRDARSVVSYATHFVRARKRPAAAPAA